MSAASSFELSSASRVRAVSISAILGVLAAIKVAIQFTGIRSYGFFRDELYYLACGRHLAWGYIDQPPLVALAAWIPRHLFGDSIVGVRLLPMFAGAGIVVLTALLSRELDGGPFAQFTAALTILCAPAYLAFDSFLSMNAFEPLFWLLCAWIIVRIINGASARLWIAFGVFAGIGLENKHTMLAFGFALVVGLLLTGHAQLLFSRWAWLALGIALVIFLPNLIWEFRHGWPQIEVVRNAEQFKNEPVTPLRFLGEQVLFLDPLALPIWLGGLIWFLVSPDAKKYRFLGVTYLIVLAVVMACREKTYYPLPAYPLLAAAGGVALERLAWPLARWGRAVLPMLIVIGGVLGAPLAVPMLSLDSLAKYSQAFSFARVQTERDSTAQLSQLFADELPWQNITQHVAVVYRSLPSAEQSTCAISAGNYGEAGAIDLYGPMLGLPRAISGHNSYYTWGPRSYDGSCVILFGERARQLSQYFGDVHLADTITNPDAMPAEQHVEVFICRKPSAPLRLLWPYFRMII